MSHYYAFQEALKHFKAANPVEMAEKSGVDYDGTGTFTVNYCNKPYKILHSTGEIIGPEGEDLLESDQILLYQYLSQATGVPVTGRWISYLELPNGEHHYVPFKIEAMGPLARKFGSDLDGFHEAAGKMGGKEIKMGHAGFVIPALPRVPLAVALWEGDDEFPANANVIFDASAPDYLTPAALYVLGINVVRKMCGQKSF